MGKTVILTERQYLRYKKYLFESMTFDEITSEAELADKNPTEAEKIAGN